MITLFYYRRISPFFFFFCFVNSRRRMDSLSKPLRPWFVYFCHVTKQRTLSFSVPLTCRCRTEYFWKLDNTLILHQNKRGVRRCQSLRPWDKRFCPPLLELPDSTVTSLKTSWAPVHTCHLWLLRKLVLRCICNFWRNVRGKGTLLPSSRCESRLFQENFVNLDSDTGDWSGPILLVRTKFMRSQNLKDQQPPFCYYSICIFLYTIYILSLLY